MESRNVLAVERTLGRFLLDNCSDAIVVLDRDGAVVASNRASARFAPGVDLGAWLSGNDGPCEAELASFREALQAEGHARAEVAVCAGSGRGPRRLVLEGSTVDLYRVVVVRDVTLDRATTDELGQLRRVESAGLLAMSAVHDLNNLLTPILCLSARLADGRADDADDVTDLAREVTTAAERAAALARRLLSIGRRGQPRFERVNPNDVVLELRALVELMLGQGIALELALDGTVGDTRVDRDALEHVVLNLVANARDAMPRGGRVVIRTRNDVGPAGDAGTAGPPCIAITVEDDGVGLPPEAGDRIFERFFTTKQPGAGTGLGLASVRRFVVESGGWVDVHSRQGEGTAITLRLPRLGDVDDAAGEAHPSSDAPPSRPAEPPGGNELVLVVEGSDPLRGAVQRILESHGYEVVAATSGRDALAVASAQARPVDLVLTDVGLTDLDGPSLVAALRGTATRAPPRALLMSGQPPHALAQRGVDGVALPLLRKPFGYEALLRSVRAALDAPADGEPATPRS